MPTGPALPHAVSLPRFSSSSAYPHVRKRRLLPLVKVVGNGILVLMVLAALMAILVDVVNQFVHSDRRSKVANIISALGLYVNVLIAALILSLLRIYQDVKAMATVPHGYLPVTEEDAPKSSHCLIKREFDRVSVITRVAQPRGRKFAGWGERGSPFDGVHFRSAILGTAPTLHKALRSHFPLLASTSSSRSSSLSPLGPLLAFEPSPVPAALRPLAQLYEQKLLEAKYGELEPTDEDWDAVVKVVAVLVGVLQGGKETKEVYLAEER